MKKFTIERLYDLEEGRQFVLNPANTILHDWNTKYAIDEFYYKYLKESYAGKKVPYLFLTLYKNYENNN